MIPFVLLLCPLPHAEILKFSAPLSPRSLASVNGKIFPDNWRSPKVSQRLLFSFGNHLFHDVTHLRTDEVKGEVGAGCWASF